MLEAVQRFFDPPEISNPKWILVIGSLGLAMNILGLFLFHDHGHGHGHAHGKGLEHGAEEGRAVADGRGNIDIVPLGTSKIAKAKSPMASRTHLSTSAPNGSHRTR